MSNQLCPCAKLFKIGDDYTREHHPDCLIANAEKFGQLVREGVEHLRERLELTVESMQGVAPRIYAPPKAAIITPLVTIEGVCLNCETSYTAVDCEIQTDREAIKGHYFCDGCQRTYYFNVKGVFQ